MALPTRPVDSLCRIPLSADSPYGRYTLVECKRFADSRARREMVGQMLEKRASRTGELESLLVELIEQHRKVE